MLNNLLNAKWEQSRTLNMPDVMHSRCETFRINQKY